MNLSARKKLLFLLITISNLFCFSHEVALAGNIKKHTFLVKYHSGKVVDVQKLELTNDDAVLVLDDSIHVSINSIKSIVHEKPGDATLETVTGAVIGTTVGLALGSVAMEAIFLASENPYYGNNAGLAFITGLSLIGGGIVAGTIIGHSLGADKLYDFDKMPPSKQRKVLKKLSKKNGGS